MIAQSLRQVLEATGYLEDGEPAHGVYLEDDARTRCHAREFEPETHCWGLSAHCQFNPNSKKTATGRRGKTHQNGV